MCFANWQVPSTPMKVFSNNMGKKFKPVITKCKESENWTKVTFKPDLAKFNMTHLEDDVVALMKKRVIDLAGCLGKTVKVELNGQRIPVKSFLDYVNLMDQAMGLHKLCSLKSFTFHTKIESKQSGIQGNEKELAYLLEEKNMSLAAIQAAHESEINNLGLELEKERDKLANIQLKLQEELKLNESFQEELNLSKVDKDKKMEMNKIRDELNEKILEVRRLQIELTRRENAETDDIVDGLKRVIATLEQENNNLKVYTYHYYIFGSMLHVCSKIYWHLFFFLTGFIKLYYNISNLAP
ncbi:uncharacterized protein LOC114306576 [Camellia sinensis]|uniref:uncharacterized protein LOC114306576 n=1 Tax=Camellia sinensis TaxID=4442 RepID=UPI0010363E5A|nr:uncharacterized protein LOC114306576 [Camellia sinensis]